MTKRVFLAVWCLLALVKLALAIAMPLFGDEAFYWWEGQHPAWSYSDLPPLTAWLTALGSAVLPGEFGVRAPFLLLALALPWQLVAMTRRWYAPADAWRAGLLGLLLPLAAVLGVLALPDVPLVALSLFAVQMFLVALHDSTLRSWLLFGAACALGLLCHYRFAALLLLFAVLMLAHPAGRAALRASGPWWAVGTAGLGLLPMVVFNLSHEWAGVRFQLLDRHPWAWQGSGLLQIPEQALVASPLLLVLLGWTAWRVWRGSPRVWPEGVLVALAAGLWLLFFVLGFFADNERFRWHWPLTAYLLLIPPLAARLPLLGRRLIAATFALAATITIAVLGYFAATIAPDQAATWLGGKQFPANFSGWREASAWLDAAPMRSDERLVVDNFMLAAALSFYRPAAYAQDLRVLDDGLNRRHGRAAQLAIWGVDEQSLAADPASPGWLVAEETARRFSDRWSWYQGLCARFSGLRIDQGLQLHAGRKRFLRWRYQAYKTQPSCTQPAAIPPLGWVEAPARVRSGEAISVFGWAVQPVLAITAVEVLLDGQPVVQPERTLAIGWVRQHWGEVADPAGDRLGFRAQIATDGLGSGRHRLLVQVRRADGLIWPVHEQDVLVAP